MNESMNERSSGCSLPNSCTVRTDREPVDWEPSRAKCDTCKSQVAWGGGLGLNG